MGGNIASIKISHMDDIESAVKEAAEYAHNLVYQISEVMVDGPADTILWDEVNEAWFFDRNSELHFYRTEDNLACVRAEEQSGAVHVVTRTYEIAEASSRGRSDKKILEIREYLDFDEDGQCYVAYTRLADIR